MVIPPKSIPPSIPVKKVPPNSYTGRGKDIPGPANYNPNVDTVKTKHRAADFAKKEKTREVFSTRSAENPGPGVYDYKNDIASKTASTFNTSGQSPMFLSKVPNCKDTKDDNGIPGPGSYIDKKKKALHQRSNSYRVELNGRGFLTSVKREGYWDNTLEAPFTKGTNIVEVPGPGKYQNDKKRDPQKDKYNEIQSAKPAFHSTDTRDCLRRSGKASSPGPGQYIDLNSSHFLSNQNIQRYSSERGMGGKYASGKMSHFTTKSMRFTGGFFQAKEGPGPGEYDSEVKSADNELKGILTKAQIRNKGKGGAVFKSTTNRFVENEPSNPCVRILDKKPDYRSDLIIDNMKTQASRTNYEGMLKPSKRVGFTATSPRFTHNQVFYGEKLKYTPGPGDYVANNLRPKTYSQSRGVGRKQVFNSYIPSKGTNAVVGPGSYISTE